MKFKILVKEAANTSREPWWEEYDKETNDPHQWGIDIVEWFNSTLRKGEKRRKFIRAETIVDNPERIATKVDEL
jgi:hypothetical protein